MVALMFCASLFAVNSELLMPMMMMSWFLQQHTRGHEAIDKAEAGKARMPEELCLDGMQVCCGG